MPARAKGIREDARREKPGKRKVIRISVSSLLAGREIENAGQLKESLQVIEKKALDVLKDSDVVELI